MSADALFDFQVVGANVSTALPIHIKVLLAGYLFLECLIIIHLHLLFLVLGTLHELPIAVNFHAVGVVASCRRNQSRGPTVIFVESEQVISILQIVFRILLVVEEGFIFHILRLTAPQRLVNQEIRIMLVVLREILLKLCLKSLSSLVVRHLSAANICQRVFQRGLIQDVSFIHLRRVPRVKPVFAGDANQLLCALVKNHVLLRRLLPIFLLILGNRSQKQGALKFLGFQGIPKPNGT